MALTADAKPDRRGPPAGGSYGYQVAPGEQIYRGSIVGLNSSGYLQRVQTAGTVVLVGVSQENCNNVGNSAASINYLCPQRGRWQFTVPSATAANIGAVVYATDDNTVTLTAGSNLAFGTLDGIDNGLTWVRVSGT